MAGDRLEIQKTIMDKPDLFSLDRFEWLKIWLHYHINHGYNVDLIGVSYNLDGYAGRGYYWRRQRGRDWHCKPLTFQEFAGLDRLRPGGGPGRWYGTWPRIYNYYHQTYPANGNP